jgi:multidrug efflux pump subunit AcrA (membrane-fusion protein)
MSAVPDPPEPASPRRLLNGRLGGWVFGILTLASVLAIAAVSVRQTQKVSAKTDRPVGRAKKGEFLVIVSCRGELVAGKSELITAPTKVPDLRIIFLAPQGSPVKPGDTILRFDDSSAKRQLQEAEAALRQAQASLDQAIADARTNEDKDNLDLADAGHAVERAKLDVAKAEIVSALQAKEYELDLKLAEEKRRVQEAATRLNHTSGESKIASFRTLRDKSQGDVEITRKRIEQMTVLSPSEGVVTYLMNFSQGWVNARPFKVGDNVWPGSAVAEIPDLTTLHMKAKVEEMDRSRLVIGQSSRIALDPFPEKQFPGKVVRVSPLTEQNFEWPPSRNFRVFATVQEGDARLRPGMNGRLDIVVDRIHDAISVPAKAVFTRNGRPVVLLPTDKGLKPVDVAVVARNPDEVAVRGIQPGVEVALSDDLAGEKK